MRSFVCALLLFSVAAFAAHAQVVPGRYIVKVKSGAAPAAVVKAHGVAADHVYTHAVKGFAGSIPPGQLKALQQDPWVESIVPDRVVKAIGNVKAQVRPEKTPRPTPTPAPQVVPAGVSRIGASPASSLYTGAGVGVAIVDTGIDFAHADLTVSASSFTAYASSQDDNGHGTHVAGIVAARNNDIDVVGVAPGATLYAVKVLNASGSGYDSDIIAGLDWISQNASSVTPAIRVANMSLGRPGSLNDDPSLRAAIQSLYNAGIVVVVSAGNSNNSEVSQQIPSGYPEVLAVASTTAQAGTSKSRTASAIPVDTASFFTTDGAFSTSTHIGVTISAPGEDQENLAKNGAASSVGILSTRLGGGTTRMSGTSMASPHVCGVVARLFEANSGIADVETVRSLIRSNASGVGTLPLDNPAWNYSYSFDGEREGVVQVPELW
ncbi:S8 family serine peptidase [bacterium]|nr:S8 family serine peptidase [bacterium]